MKVLQQGLEPKERVEILIGFTNIESPNIKEGLMDHLSRGVQLVTAAALNQVQPGNLSRALSTLESVAKKVERIKEIDYSKVHNKVSVG